MGQPDSSDYGVIPSTTPTQHEQEIFLDRVLKGNPEEEFEKNLNDIIPNTVGISVSASGCTLTVFILVGACGGQSLEVGYNFPKSTVYVAYSELEWHGYVGLPQVGIDLSFGPVFHYNVFDVKQDLKGKNAPLLST